MAQSPEDSEARTAAKMAVDLIRRENLQISATDTTALPARVRDLEAQLSDALAEVEQNRFLLGEQADMIDDQTRALDELNRVVNAQRVSLRELQAELNARSRAAAQRSVVASRAAGRARFQARFGGTCRGCGGCVVVGEVVYWKRGEGVLHERCASSADAAT